MRGLAAVVWYTVTDVLPVCNNFDITNSQCCYLAPSCEDTMLELYLNRAAKPDEASAVRNLELPLAGGRRADSLPFHVPRRNRTVQLLKGRRDW